MRLVTTSLLVVVMGCTGDAPPGGGGGGADADPNARLCEATFNTSGTFAPDPNAVRNTDPDTGDPGTGCWPYGTWTFKTEIVANNCSPAPSIGEYQFKVTRVLNEEGDGVPEYSYLTDPAAQSQVKTSQGGSGLCAGEVDLYSDDGKTVYNLRPELNEDNSITGDGEYSIYATDQSPF